MAQCAHPFARELGGGDCPLCPPGISLPVIVPRADGWISSVTGHGISTYDKTLGTTFLADVITPWQAEELWRGNDLAARIIEMWPNEMLRQGFELRVDADAGDEDEAPETDAEADAYDRQDWAAWVSAVQRRAARSLTRRIDHARARRDAESTSKDLVEQVTGRWEDLGLIRALWQAYAYMGAYGGGAILLGVNDGSSDMAQPLDEERVISFDWLTTLDARELIPVYWYSDPTAPKFGEVELYWLNPQLPGSPKPGGALPAAPMLIHESRLCVFDGSRTSRQMTTITGWGDSKLTRFLPVLSEFGIAWKSAAILVADFAPAVFKIKGLAQAMTNDKDNIVKIRAQAAALSKSTARAVLIDSEEEYKREQTPLAGLPEMLDRFASRLAVAADIPVELLFEKPAGLNANGDSAIRSHYDKVKAKQIREIRPAVTKISRLIMRSLGLAEPANWCVEFPSLWQPTEKEQAEARKIQAEADKIYLDTGVLSSEEVAMSRFGGDAFSFDTQVDFDARAAGEPVAEGPAKTEAQLETEQKEADAKAAQLETMRAGQPAQPPSDGTEQQDRLDYVEQRGAKWVVLSKSGKLLGTYSTEAEAVARLRQIEAHK